MRLTTVVNRIRRIRLGAALSPWFLCCLSLMNIQSIPWRPSAMALYQVVNFFILSWIQHETMKLGAKGQANHSGLKTWLFLRAQESNPHRTWLSWKVPKLSCFAALARLISSTLNSWVLKHFASRGNLQLGKIEHQKKRWNLGLISNFHCLQWIVADSFDLHKKQLSQLSFSGRSWCNRKAVAKKINQTTPPSQSCSRQGTRPSGLHRWRSRLKLELGQAEFQNIKPATNYAKRATRKQLEILTQHNAYEEHRQKIEPFCSSGFEKTHEFKSLQRAKLFKVLSIHDALKD